MFIGIPCTTSNKTGRFMYLLETFDYEFSINFSQIKEISSKRLLRRMSDVSTRKEIIIKEKFVSYINRKPTD